MLNQPVIITIPRIYITLFLADLPIVPFFPPQNRYYPIPVYSRFNPMSHSVGDPRPHDPETRPNATETRPRVTSGILD